MQSNRANKNRLTENLYDLLRDGCVDLERRRLLDS